MIIHSDTPPPRPHTQTDNNRVSEQNAMQAFPQEKISHYTTAHKKKFQRYLLIIAIKLAILHCYYSCYSIPCMSILEIKPYVKTRLQKVQSISTY